MTYCACGFVGTDWDVWIHVYYTYNPGKHFMVAEYKCMCTTIQNNDCLIHGEDKNGMD
jgi:hypothetical protein